MRFKEYLQEALGLAKVNFNDYTKGTSDMYVYDFTVKDRAYKSVFERDTTEINGVWDYEFKAVDSESNYGILNLKDGSEFKVLSIAFGYLVEFLKNMNPEKVIFSSDEENRSSVYKRILTRIDPILKDNGFTYKQIGSGNATHFVIEKE